jgi:hypothetical protein
LIEYFTAQWREKFGDAYAFQRGKDGAAIKRILEACGGDCQKAKGFVDAYLADTNPWLATKGHTVSVLASEINGYLAGAHRGSNNDGGEDWQPREPTEEDLAIAHGKEDE